MYPGVLCAAGVYYTRDRIDTLESEVTVFKNSVAEDAKATNANIEGMKQAMEGMKTGLHALLDRQMRLEQAQSRKCVTMFGKK